MPAAIVCCVVSASFAKLPAPPPVDPAKAEEAKQKAAEAAKKARAAEEAAMDRAVARYKKEKGMAMASTPAKAGAARGGADRSARCVRRRRRGCA